ncbi:MAG: proton-conducting transporter membrane subunit [candidate division WOR-3 bacterium]|nr:proton-conducting transporter membrane subunit [candidate division WOR-3 bacterium]
MNEVYLMLLLPVGCGLLGFLIKRLRNEMGFLGFIVTFYFALRIFLIFHNKTFAYSIASIAGIDFRIYADNLTRFILLFNSVFALLILLYSIITMRKSRGEDVYQLYLGLTLSGANGVVLSGNLFLMLIFWNMLVFALYGILLVGKKESVNAARKALTIVGVSDFILMLGIIIVYTIAGSANFPAEPLLSLNNGVMISAYMLLLVGAIAKAGAMPLHTWIPEAARVVPASTMAFIPACIDKLLGIYFLVRISYYLFDITQSLPVRMTLMSIGAITIVFAVMMALIQKEAMRLLSFHAVSQVGYMVLGIGTGIPLAVAGGLFHMINNAIYKMCLFLCAGSVEYRARTSELDHLGGLGTKMPLTMLCFLIAAFAISGVPPFNGFYSKWMIYQGIIELYKETNLWIIFLVAAMFGSVLTLASFLKMLHSLFLGERPKELDKVREVRFGMIVPPLILAFLCIIFGIFAEQIPLARLIYPSLPFFKIEPIGFWSAGLTTVLMLLGILIGLIIFIFGTALKPRKSKVFVGGEVLDTEEARITGPNFYSSVHNIDMLEKTYRFGEEGAFDFYNYLQGIFGGFGTLFREVINKFFVLVYNAFANIIISLGYVFSAVHNGELPGYLGWIFLGAIFIFILLAL